MDAQGRKRIDEIVKTFERNFKITRLYAAYLENCPDIITEEMVESVRRDTGLSRESVLIGILCELFGIDVDRGSEDRILIRDYLTPSVRILDAKKYTENPYYKNVKIPEVKDGDWEFKKEKYPAYRGVVAADMIMEKNFREIPPLGFFTEDFYFPAVLEGGNEWMTLTPVDIDTCTEAIEEAVGKVVTFGLGLGYYAYMASQKPEVTSLTVVEKSPDVIRLFKKHLLPQFPHADKIKIVEADAFLYAERIMPSEKFDYAFVDTWRDAGDGAPMYERMKRLEKLSPETRFSYWIENFLLSRHRAEAFARLTEEAVSDAEEFARKLTNPLDL